MYDFMYICMLFISCIHLFFNGTHGLSADYHRLRVGGLILAAVLCLIGITILFSKMQNTDTYSHIHYHKPFLHRDLIITQALLSYTEQNTNSIMPPQCDGGILEAIETAMTCNTMVFSCSKMYNKSCSDIAF